ncbi:isoprenoid biosynthesis glyoxalase ElbB [Facilibium subflavum]|uniref:isoprenoid biosynthesis glyoxalase ElbB n=1 Tax=Facilibium subflavum TaxID=2219058 RepID=UPI000E65567A|nr:isoprenoid biosynthesis glyoxalase ElbB [Facilibium subflavum]
MTKKVAVVLSGCGCFDGAEIHESVLTLLALSKNGADYEVIAPNKDQYHVINHATGKEMPEKRNILVEAARIARGEIKDLARANPEDYDALIFPGGFGAAKNLFDFALKQDESYEVDPDVIAFIKAFKQAQKPVGFICIAPMMIPLVYPSDVKMTIGNEQSVAKIVQAKGAQHINTAVDAICIDEKNKVVSTSAYMLGQNPYEVSQGIEKLVNKVLEMSKSSVHSL